MDLTAELAAQVASAITRMDSVLVWFDASLVPIARALPGEPASAEVEVLEMYLHFHLPHGVVPLQSGAVLRSLPAEQRVEDLAGPPNLAHTETGLRAAAVTDRLVGVWQPYRVHPRIRPTLVRGTEGFVEPGPSASWFNPHTLLIARTTSEPPVRNGTVPLTAYYADAAGFVLPESWDLVQRGLYEGWFLGPEATAYLDFQPDAADAADHFFLANRPFDLTRLTPADLQLVIYRRLTNPFYPPTLGAKAPDTIPALPLRDVQELLGSGFLGAEEPPVSPEPAEELARLTPAFT
jgi:hypothetical protein